ncbi:MAG: hypothetical protein ACREGE_00215 [Candidatus Microsaccharimonas sp.]
MPGVSRQRERFPDALRLSHEASAALQPLHDDLAEVSPTFDGIVYFAKDTWHKNNASAAATVQPRSNDAERFDFYKNNIAHHRVDLGATALGLGLALNEPQLLRSRMNPNAHTTWAQRTIVDNELTGGVQAAFNSKYGAVPTSTETISKIWKHHEKTAIDVAAAFRNFSTQVRSIGDVLELEAPATPNAILASWDLKNSTGLSHSNYGALRNYLLDTKSLFSDRVVPYDSYIHDTGDGQDIALFLPELSDTFDRANKADVRGFANTHVLPLIGRLLSVHDELAKDYQDIDPTINFAVGLGYVEHDVYDGRTSQSYWENASLLKTHPTDVISYTQSAKETLFPTT